MNIINIELRNKIDKFWASYTEMVDDSNFASEFKKCEDLMDSEEELSDEEEDYVYAIANLRQNVVDSIKNDTSNRG